MSRVDWRPYGRERKTETTPDAHYDLVWINEAFYHGVTMGYFDGFTWCTFAGSDDCHVTHWAPIEYPEPPEEAD